MTATRVAIVSMISCPGTKGVLRDSPVVVQHTQIIVTNAAMFDLDFNIVTANILRSYSKGLSFPFRSNAAYALIINFPLHYLINLKFQRICENIADGDSMRYADSYLLSLGSGKKRIIS